MNASVKNYKNLNPKHKKIIFYTLVGVLLFAFGTIGLGLSENKLLLENEHIEITGVYGEKIPVSDIRSIELTDKRHSLKRRTNGFSRAGRKKDFFKATSGEKIKLIINSQVRPWILITKKSVEKIYFSASEQSNESIYQELKKTLPSKTKINS